jgi:hypothetical protein
VMAIELTCRICGKPYTPTKADIQAGPETYHRCPTCRPDPVATARAEVQLMRREVAADREKGEVAD